MPTSYSLRVAPNCTIDVFHSCCCHRCGELGVKAFCKCADIFSRSRVHGIEFVYAAGRYTGLKLKFSAMSTLTKAMCSADLMCIYIRSGKQVERASACEPVNEAEGGTTGMKAGRRQNSRKCSIDVLISIGHNLDGPDCPCRAVVVCGCELSHWEKREEGCKGFSVRFAKR